MALTNTNLLIQMSQIPATFTGTPNDLAGEMVRRMRIVSPSGAFFIFIGDTEPTSNVGPWLKNGTQWWVWDDDTKRYVPLDITQSQINWYWMSASTPPNSTPPLWLKTTQDQTETDPSHGQPIGWYEFNGTAWVPFLGIILSGPTANRPSSPVEYQQFYDTDISVLIWWERGQWRTVSGVPGDIKFVTDEVLANALTRYPGWDLYASGNQTLRGRIIMQASKNADGSNPVTVPPNVAQRRAGETFGETDFVAINDTALDSAPKTATQALFVVTASAAFFNPQMVGQEIVFTNGSPTVTITAFTDSTHVTVNISQTVGATTFQIPASNVPYPPQVAAWALVKL
jgi:hypothetical protein